MNLILHTFKLRFTSSSKKKGVRKNAEFRRKFGNMPIMQAYKQYKVEQELLDKKILDLRTKINNFENFLRKQGVKCTQSNISESRYYYYNNKKYRFSGHVYPTGSMTDDLLGVVDFAADPELINEIKY